ncbi:MAG: RidA family protein [Rickettsiales bacterium]|nr:RidA family protein [Rickettsiales bacterium]
MDIEKKLQELNITIPNAAAPAANYLPYIINEKELLISGQLPMQDGKLIYQGKLGDNISDEDGIKAAELCAINLIAQAKAAVKDLNNIIKCLKLEIFVNSTENYQDHPKIGNGASNMMVNIFGEAGKHSRFAMGAHSLPFNAAVEIGAIFKIK